MLPASVDEASVYFRDGLEQMEAIGSGDNVLINELLVLSSQIVLTELDEQFFHTLSNVCELNMGGGGGGGGNLRSFAGVRTVAGCPGWQV